MNNNNDERIRRQVMSDEFVDRALNYPLKQTLRFGTYHTLL
jgi:hypothetical protein